MPKQKPLALKEFLAQSLQSGKGGAAQVAGLRASGPEENQSFLCMVWNGGPEPAVVAVNDIREAMRMTS